MLAPADFEFALPFSRWPNVRLLIGRKMRHRLFARLSVPGLY
jgi:hypothetical protein